MALGVLVLAADVSAIRNYIKCSVGVMPYTAYCINDLAFELKEMSSKTKVDLRVLGNKNELAIQTVISEKWL